MSTPSNQTSATSILGIPGLANTGAVSKVPHANARVNYDKLKVGDYVSENQYYRVDQIVGNVAVMENERGKLVQVDREMIEEGMFSANYVSADETVSQTVAAEMFDTFGAEVLQVNYTKKADKASFAAVLDNFKQTNSIISANHMLNLSEEEVLKLMKQALQGEERTLTGYITSREQKLGRVQMLDLELPATEKWRNRLVDLRTINWFIHKGTKYTVNRK